MAEIMYSPLEVGKDVLNSRGFLTRVRKHHLTDSELVKIKEKWTNNLEGVSKSIINKAGKYFFNPYRKGIYHYQIQSLFLLGCNEWHSLTDIVSKMEEIMSLVPSVNINFNAWEKFRSKPNKHDAIRCKDYIGRIQENMVFFQRLSKLHPYGYKLRQARAAVDVKRVSVPGFVNGCYCYRLSTYDSVDKALPIRDFSKFDFPLHERKYVSHKFIGTIITKDRVIKGGKEK